LFPVAVFFLWADFQASQFSDVFNFLEGKGHERDYNILISDLMPFGVQDYQLLAYHRRYPSRWFRQ